MDVALRQSIIKTHELCLGKQTWHGTTDPPNGRDPIRQLGYGAGSPRRGPNTARTKLLDIRTLRDEDVFLHSLSYKPKVRSMQRSEKAVLLISEYPLISSY